VDFAQKKARQERFGKAGGFLHQGSFNKLAELIVLGILLDNIL